MYRVLNKPILPRLKLVESETLRQNIYLLDWSYKEKSIKEYLERWAADWNKDFEYVETFPKEYDGWLKDLRFKPNDDYLKEIEHETKLGMQEWNRHRGLDTVIREYILKAATQHFTNAFYLLADCICDEEGKWVRTHRHLALSAMLYKFWEGQTGRGLVAQHSQFEIIQELSKDDDFTVKFIQLIEQNENKQNNEFYDKITGVFEDKDDEVIGGEE